MAASTSKPPSKPVQALTGTLFGVFRIVRSAKVHRHFSDAFAFGSIQNPGDPESYNDTAPA